MSAPHPVRIARCTHLTSTQNETPSFQRDMGHRVLPYFSIIHGRCAVNLSFKFVHPIPQQGHVIFPADRAGQGDFVGVVGARQRRLAHFDVRLVAEAPYQSLGSGGHPS